ncbi:MAG: VIT1/CCC1 transporter family protein [Acidimicrobiia bacterium]|nr:VIT1/CCC1 transporter family protein [Acidimicrobiia bacterium]
MFGRTRVDPAVTYRPHVGPTRQYMRDIILGVNDGLVSIFLLIVGVVGGGLSNQQVLLAGVAAAIAGAVSMAAGEYIATKSQEQVFDREMKLEREHLQYHREVERQEIRDMFGALGFEAADSERIVEIVDADDEAFLKVMMALEFGVVDTERRSPRSAMLVSGLLFLAGSVPSILPFVFTSDPYTGLWIAAVGSGIAVFGVGALKTVVTHTNPILSGLENVGIAVVGAAVSYGVGTFFDAAV